MRGAVTLYSVVARIEGPAENGNAQSRNVCVRRGVPRGTGEALAFQYIRDGFRMDAERGSTHYPPHRILVVEVVPDSEEEGD